MSPSSGHAVQRFPAAVAGVTGAAEGLLSRVFARVAAWRWTVVAFYALLLPPSAYFASQVEQDNSLDRLIVATDPDYLATHGFQQVFGRRPALPVLGPEDREQWRYVAETGG